MLEYVDQFINFLEIEKMYSKETTVNYKIDLYLFVNYINDIKIYNYKDITYDDLRKYLYYLTTEKNYSNKTISRHISSLQSFFNYLVNENVITNNPMKLINSPKKELRLPVYLTGTELEDLVNTPNRNTLVGLRDSLILEMFYSTGIRLSELVDIKIKDIDFVDKKIKITGKGSKQRYVLYGDRCKNYLEDYINNYRSKFHLDDEDLLFLNQKGNPITASGIEYIVKNILVKSGINVKLTPHVLRHTFATHMLNEGADLMTVKELLGHSDLSTTGVYTHVSNEHMRKEYLNAHPRARRK